MSRLLWIVALLASQTFAKTDLAGCTSTTVGNSITYYLPDTGEICAFLDCGGGRAPPKTTVPGCPQYVGTATYSPSFLPLATTTTSVQATATLTTGSPTVTSAELSTLPTIVGSSSGAGSSQSSAASGSGTTRSSSSSSAASTPSSASSSGGVASGAHVGIGFGIGAVVALLL